MVNEIVNSAQKCSTCGIIYYSLPLPTMTNEELIQEMKEQALEDALLGYRDHHTYDDAASTPVEIDYTTQS